MHTCDVHTDAVDDYFLAKNAVRFQGIIERASAQLLIESLSVSPIRKKIAAGSALPNRLDSRITTVLFMF